MTNFELAAQAAHEAKQAYTEAHEDYITAAPGRDLTIKQGKMQQCRVAFRAALEHFFDEYEKSGVL